MANEDTFHLGVKALIINKAGKILVLRSNPKKLTNNEPDHWDLPGGRLQKGDQNLEETLRREVKEEIGITQLKIIEFFDCSIAKLRIHHKHGLVLYTFICSVNNVNIKLTDDEHSEFGWFSPKEAAKLLSTKFSDEFVERLSKMSSRT